MESIIVDLVSNFKQITVIKFLIHHLKTNKLISFIIYSKNYLFERFIHIFT